MPELPEVEIVRQSLNRQVKNRKIINIQVNNRNLRLKVPKDFEQIFKNAVIEKIQRKSKYLILVFNNNLYCVIHLGCLLYTSPSPRDKRQSRMPSSA